MRGSRTTDGDDKTIWKLKREYEYIKLIDPINRFNHIDVNNSLNYNQVSQKFRQKTIRSRKRMVGDCEIILVQP